ncbi:hypothetical protein A2U01_0090509, partial [Trifolium medium]|nr:hypothetical protein [Trifolium medium]
RTQIWDEGIGVMVGDGGWWWSVMEVVTVGEANKRNGGQAARQWHRKREIVKER